MGHLKDKIIGGFFSSTMWFGFVIMLTQWLNNNTDMLVGLVPTEYQDLAGYAIGTLIWFFRWITKKPVEDKIPKKLRASEILEEELQANDDYVKDF